MEAVTMVEGWVLLVVLVIGGIFAWRKRAVTVNPLGGPPPLAAATPPVAAPNVPPATTPPAAAPAKSWWKKLLTAKTVFGIMATAAVLALLYYQQDNLQQYLPQVTAPGTVSTVPQPAPSTAPSAPIVIAPWWGWTAAGEWLSNNEWWQPLLVLAIIVLALLIWGSKKTKLWTIILVAICAFIVSFVHLRSIPHIITALQEGSRSAVGVNTTNQPSPFAEVRFGSGDTMRPLTMQPSQTAVALWPGNLGARYADFCVVLDPTAVTALLGTGQYGTKRFIPGTEGRLEWTPSVALRDYHTRLGKEIEFRVYFSSDSARRHC